MKIENGILKYIDELNCPHLVFPKDMTDIDDEFYMSLGITDDIETIEVEEGNPYYNSEGNCLIEIATKTLVLGCKNSVIPDDGSVAKIGKCAFNGCQALKRLEIPQSVTELGYMSLAYTGLEALVVSEHLEEIAAHAFSLNRYLEKIVVKEK